jgi:hypothetical protein
MIGGRPISTFRLHHPIEVAVAAVAARATGGGAGAGAGAERGAPPLVLRARLLEVPYPKQNRPYPSGWEVRRGGVEERSSGDGQEHRCLRVCENKWTIAWRGLPPTPCPLLVQQRRPCRSQSSARPTRFYAQSFTSVR